MQELLGMPVDASLHGPALDRMTGWVHLLMAVLFVGWGLYFLYVLWRFRAKKNPQANYDGASGKFSKGVEVGVALVEAILLIGFAVPAWARWTKAIPEDADVERIRVVAQQFAWNIHYPGADGQFGITRPELVGPSNVIGLDHEDPLAKDDIVTINQLRLPVDRPVVVELSSIDVIHSFFLPQMRVKQDAIPGMRIPIQFQATMVTPEGDTWNIACAQLCGNSHYRMKGYYQVLSQEDYAAWLAEKAPKPPAPPAPPAAEETPGEPAAADTTADAAAAAATT
jgi:cytochrome c oxidase subunit 2